MKRRRRTWILVEGSDLIRSALAAEIESSHEVQDVQDSEPALVMMTMRESAQETLFHIGEIMVTEAKVRIGPTMGLGLIAGDRAREARELAVIDAAFNIDSPALRNWIPRLEREESRLLKEQKEEEARVARTRVEFESMDRVPQ